MKKLLTMMVAVFFGCPLFATTWYVNGTSGSDGYSGKSSDLAKKTIQAAIDAASSGDTILVAAGTYAPIDATGKKLTIRSTAGAARTHIDGEKKSRCALLSLESGWFAPPSESSGAFDTVLEGFTLVNGLASMTRDEEDNGGGGVCGGCVIGCVIRQCFAYGGGGASNAKLHRCMVVENTSNDDAGGCHMCIVYDSLICRNKALNEYGGGAGSAATASVLYNCTLTQNVAYENDCDEVGAIDYYMSAYNCIVWANVTDNGRTANITSAWGEYYGDDVNNYTSDPHFVDAANGDYRLSADSPCVDAGDNSYVTSEMDLDGNARIVNGKVDIGCYEYATRPSAAHLYMVIDLSGGATASSYPVSYLDAVPAGGWTDEYKTTKLVMRRIEPGVFTMGCASDEVGFWGDDSMFPHCTVTLTKPYYIGVFQVTQKQYELVTGENPSYYSGATRPVETVSYDILRGADKGSGWPQSSDVDNDTFMALIRQKTGINTFDLPTDAQWEYACRAGTTTSLNNGKDLQDEFEDANLDKLAQYRNRSEGTSVVGSFLPNAWGLYDMHGNVWEWCLDWFDYGDGALVAVDPVGPPQKRNWGDAARVFRGGAHNRDARECRSGHRGNYGSYRVDHLCGDFGFRLAMTCKETDVDPVATKCAVTFDPAGGTAGWTKCEIAKGAAVGTLPTATREGYEFLGWFMAAVGGTQVTAATVVTEDVTFYAQWRKINETSVATYGPWGEAEAVKNPDKLGPTMLTDMTLELNGAAGAVGDVVAAFRGDTGALCGLGKVMDESGTLTMACYAPTGVKLHFKVWVAASGVEEPVVVDCDAKSDLTAPTSGAFLSGHALVVSGNKDLTISLGSADWHTVSFNVLPEDPSPAAVFGSVKDKIAAVTQGIEFWMPGKTSSLKAIEIGKGYWVNTKVDDVEWTVSGKTDPKAEIALEEGWNLVGYAPETEGAVQAVLKTALAAKAVDYVTYGVEFYPGGTLKKMEPGKAYWVHAKKAYTLVYDEVGTTLKVARLLAGAAAGDGGSTGLGAATPTYGPWGESEAVKNPDKLGPTFLTDMAVEIDGEPAEYGDVVAVFRGDTGALCGLGKVMDDSGTLTVVCYAPKGVTLGFKVWLAESGVEEPVVVKCDNASKLVAPESGDFYDGHAISGSTAAWTESVIVNKKISIETGLKGYKASGLPKGLKYDAKTGKVTGTATKVTASEGVVVKFTKKGAETEELTIIVRAEEVSVGCEILATGSFPAGVVGAAGGIPLQIETETGVKSVNVTKLPSGMKYDATKKLITGAPTTAGKYTVVLSVTTKAGAKKTVKVPVTVEAMPVMASGTFSGFVSVGEDDYFGTFTLTATSAGKLTAKAVTAKGTYSFSKTGWSSVADGIYSAKLKSSSGDVLTLVLDSTAAWDANQLSGSLTTAAVAKTKKTAAVPSYSYGVSAQRRAFGKTWYFTAAGDVDHGWTLAYTENAKAAALTVTLKADGSTAIAGKLPGLLDAKKKAVKLSASGYANVGGMRDGAIMADFAPILTVGKVKKALSIKTNLWFDRCDEHPEGVGEAKFVE